MGFANMKGSPMFEFANKHPLITFFIVAQVCTAAVAISSKVIEAKSS